MSENAPPASAGWYLWHGMADTVRYWTGTEWSEHYGPTTIRDADADPGAAPTLAAAAEKASAAVGETVPSRERACAYCGGQVAAQATRCPHCSGQFVYCWRCRTLRAVNKGQKFVGILRGGKQTVQDCRVCGKRLTGPRT